MFVFCMLKLISSYSCKQTLTMYSSYLLLYHHYYRFIFTKFIHESNSKGKANTRKIDLVQKASTEASQHFDNRQRFVLDGLLKMKAAASDIQTAIRLFQEVDADNSGVYCIGCRVLCDGWCVLCMG